MRHVLSAVVQNVPGVLAHISGMLASRGYNIESLAVGETENKNLSRMTFVVVGDNRVSEQVRKQLEKIVTVVAVQDISSRDYVERDLMLVKVRASSGALRTEIRECDPTESLNWCGRGVSPWFAAATRMRRLVPATMVI